MLTGNLNATRFAQKPIPHPNYSFAHVPKPTRDLTGSVVQRVENREHFQECMAEMLLVCKEATRRRPEQKEVGGSKPLSLEYLADRLDIDDPCFGYLIRTHENKNDVPNFKKGMLQGFITVTTFTNWQKTFEWDSANEAAYECDNEDQDIKSGKRKWDEDCSLSKELQASVRFGDIWNEGIVWPRVAEISLLGALGCGRALVSLVIEELEGMKASGRANYDFVVLQATDNSIPFYESMGFTRVGTVMKDIKEPKPDSAINENGEIIEPPEEIVSSPITSYVIKKPGESLNDIARKLKVDVWDIVFLNRHIIEELAPSSKLIKGTVLQVPVHTNNNHDATEKNEDTKPNKADNIKWHIAKENETPRSIAKLYGVSTMDVVKANKGRLEGLMSSSRLKDGTKVKVSHLDILDNDYKPYSHWSFPDDEFEDGEPSYMMVRKLNRRKGKTVFEYPFRESLSAVFSGYERTNLLMMPSPVSSPESTVPAPSPSETAKKTALENQQKETPILRKPKFPDLPRSAYMIFLEEQRILAQDELKGLSIGDVSRTFGELWRDLPGPVRAKYDAMASEAKKLYEQKKKDYAVENAKYESQSQQKTTPVEPVETQPLPSTVGKNHGYSLFNTVVRLRPGPVSESTEYKYWYVLTFIPDLKWCHLAPMIQVGKFGADKPRAKGRPKWKLVDESLGHEVDISSSFCIPIKSKSMKKTLDADKEEWDIIDDGSDPTTVKRLATPRVLVRDAYDSDIPERSSDASETIGSDHKSSRKTPAIKPSVERKRKRASNTKTPPLQALIPGVNRMVSVRLEGEYLMNKPPPILSPTKKPRKVVSSVKFKEKWETLPRGDERAAGANMSKGQPKKLAYDDSMSSATSTNESSIKEKTDSQGHSNTGKGSAVTKKTDKKTLKPTTIVVSSRKHSSVEASPARPRRAAAPVKFEESSSEPDESEDETVDTLTSDSSDSEQLPSSLDDSIVKATRASRSRRKRRAARSKDSSTTETDENVARSPRLRKVTIAPKYQECNTSDSDDFMSSGTESESMELHRSSTRTNKSEKCRNPQRRPRRTAAPSFLGESQMKTLDASTPKRSNRSRRSQPLHEKDNEGSESSDDHLSESRGNRKSTPSFLGEGLPRKPRTVKSVGSRRSVLQD